MTRFSVLRIGRYAQYKFAWYELHGEAQYTDPAPTCPSCGGPVGMLRGWRAPNEVVLKQPRHVGDFVAGAGGCDFLVSERVLEAAKNMALIGFQRVFPITVVRMGTTAKARSYPRPQLYGVELTHSRAQVDHEAMDVVWRKPPQKAYCRLCGPGGGGTGGIWKSIGRVVVMEESWTGEDVFYAINFSGTILLSKKAADMVTTGGYTNVEVIPCERYAHSL